VEKNPEVLVFWRGRGTRWFSPAKIGERNRFALFAIRGGEEPRKAEISSFNSDEEFYLFKAGRTKKLNLLM
jgi:hypothetical protein